MQRHGLGQRWERTVKAPRWCWVQDPGGSAHPPHPAWTLACSRFHIQDQIPKQSCPSSPSQFSSPVLGMDNAAFLQAFYHLSNCKASNGGFLSSLKLHVFIWWVFFPFSLSLSFSSFLMSWRCANYERGLLYYCLAPRASSIKAWQGPLGRREAKFFAWADKPRGEVGCF